MSRRKTRRQDHPPRNDPPRRAAADDVRPSDEEAARAAERPRAEPPRWVRVVVLLLGVLMPLVVLYGPALAGHRLLLPLDTLTAGGVYLPPGPDGTYGISTDGALSDLVYQTEVHRRFVVDEVRAGRVPLWNPFSYAGHPLLAANHTQVFSPYRLLDYAFPSPVAVAWGTVLRSVVAAAGAYLFFRRATGAGWLAAAFGGWCVPLGGTMVLSAGYPGAAVVSFLPWILLAADRCAVRPSGRSTAGMAVVVACALLAGHAAFAAQVLLAAGAYFAWRHVSIHGWRGAVARTGWPGLAAAGGGVLLGVLLSAPQTLPTADYLRDSLRISRRGAGTVETPPAGPSALVQLVLPYARGSTRAGAAYPHPELNRIESAAGGYAGLLAVLVLAPIGWADPTRRRWMRFWTVLAALAVVPTVGVPVLDLLFRVPPLPLLRNNRLVFVAGFALTALAVLGLDALLDRSGRTRRTAVRWAAVAGLVVALSLLGWAATKAFLTPVGPTGESPAAGNVFVLLWPDRWTAATGDLDPVSWFGLMYRNGVLLTGLAAALAGSVLVAAFRRRAGAGAGPIIPIGLSVTAAVLAVAEMTAAASAANVQGEWAHYYPRLAWMDVVARRPGRICGVNCLPANLGLSHRLPDIRGYDAADPLPIVDLLLLAQDADEPSGSPSVAVTQLLNVDPVRPGPVADLLGVRYVVGRGAPPAGAKIAYAGEDYWLAENDRALPRATVPGRVEVVKDPAERLRRLADPNHDPAAVALLDPTAWTSDAGMAAQGAARIGTDEPNRVVVEVDLAKGGIVRLADAWDGGWRATYNGRPTEVLRVDHALRGVSVPAGPGTIEFRYEPASFRWGLILATVAACGTVAAAIGWRSRPA